MHKQYLPAAYIDETYPQPRQSPSDWIARADDGALLLAGDADYDWPPRPLAIGDIVAFEWTESYGAITIVIAADGSFTSRDMPDPRANNVWIRGDADTLDESVENFARNWIENGEAAGEVELEQFAWSDTYEHYRLDLVDGVACFVLAPQA